MQKKKNHKNVFVLVKMCLYWKTSGLTLLSIQPMSSQLQLHYSCWSEHSKGSWIGWIRFVPLENKRWCRSGKMPTVARVDYWRRDQSFVSPLAKSRLLSPLPPTFDERSLIRPLSKRLRRRSSPVIIWSVTLMESIFWHFILSPAQVICSHRCGG